MQKGLVDISAAWAEKQARSDIGPGSFAYIQILPGSTRPISHPSHTVRANFEPWTVDADPKTET